MAAPVLPLRLDIETVLGTLEDAHAGYWSWDVQTDSVVALPYTLGLFGLSSEKELRGFRTLLMRVREEDRDRVESEIALVLREGTELDSEFAIRLHGRGERYVRFKGRARRNEKGRVTHLEGVALDVTDRTVALKALEKAENHYATLVNSLDGIVWEADGQTFEFSFVSPQAFRILGYPVEDWLTKPAFWADHVHPDDRDWCIRFCKEKTADGQDHEFEYRMIAADGRVVWLHDVVSVARGPNGELRLRGIMVDVSERKRVEGALSESERRFRVFFDELQHPMAITDPSGRLLQYNGAFLKLIGRSEGDTSELNFRDFYHPDELVDAEENLRCATTRRVTRKLIRSDGEIIWADLIGVAITPEKGAPYWISLFQDITAEKRAEAAVQESEQVFRSLFEQSTAGMVIGDLEGNIVQSNETFQRFLGYSGEELTGLHARDFVHPDHVEEATKNIANNSTSYAVRKYVRKDGAIRWGRVSAVRIRPEAKAGYWVAVIQDITAEKQAEEILRESEERFRIVANDTPAYLWTMAVQKDGQLEVFANRRLVEFLGIDPAAPGPELVERIHPDERAAIVEQFLECLQERREFEREFRIRRSDGEYRAVVDHGIPRFAPDGTLLGYAGSMVDITDRKVAEQKSAASQRELSRQLIERRRAEQQVLRLSDRLLTAHEEERSRIARELHDDLSQQIAAVSILLSSIKSSTRGRDVGATEQIEKAYQRLSRIADAVRNLSHQLHPAAIEHGGLTSAIRAHCRDFTSLTRIQVHVSAEEAFTGVPSGIALTIFRVTQEALQNVAKHSGAKTVHISLTRKEDALQLKIEDEGKGFDLENMEQISAGLGLLSMRERVRLVHGSLEIQTALGAGTIVDATVPLPANLSVQSA